jgi:hypothetical protein
LYSPIAGSSSIVTTGALDAGSITSGFGAIDNGSSAITTTGVITGGTVEATTDTAAGDNAAIGYTAAEGLILTGQGSLSDVTIKNDADATVLSIPTGTTNVGIGTTSAAAQLHVQNTSGNSTSILGQYGTGTRAEITAASNEVVFKAYNGTNDVMAFYTGASERMRITSGGNALFNSTALGFANQRAVQIQTSSTGLIGIQHPNTEGDGAAYVWFTHNGGAIGSIVQDGTSGVQYNVNSDYRLKENVNYTFDATTRLKQLKPARFNFIADQEKGTVDGFLAHEVSSVVPNAITGEKDAVDDDGKPIHQQIDQSKLVPLLVKTIQELEARITALEAG